MRASGQSNASIISRDLKMDDAMRGVLFLRMRIRFSLHFFS